MTLPLCRPGIWAGRVLIFLLSVGVFLEPKVLGGGKSPMSAELIRQTFETRVNWPLGAALTLVLMVVAVFVVLLFSRVYRPASACGPPHDGAAGAEAADRRRSSTARLAAVLVFFYIPIFTLIAFSFQEGRFLTLPFDGFSLHWYGELFRNSQRARPRCGIRP